MATARTQKKTTVVTMYRADHWCGACERGVPHTCYHCGKQWPVNGHEKHRGWCPDHIKRRGEAHKSLASLMRLA